MMRQALNQPLVCRKPSQRGKDRFVLLVVFVLFSTEFACGSVSGVPRKWPVLTAAINGSLRLLDTQTLNCSSSGATFVSWWYYRHEGPKPAFWQKPMRLAQLDNKTVIQLPAFPAKEGTYQCKARLSSGKNHFSNQYRFLLEKERLIATGGIGPENDSQRDKFLVAEEDADVVVNCAVWWDLKEPLQPPRLFFNGIDITNDFYQDDEDVQRRLDCHKHEFLSRPWQECSFQLGVVSSEDAGNYTCRFQNRSSMVEMVVSYAPIMKVDKYVDAVENEPVQLECSVESAFPPVSSFSWYDKNGIQIPGANTSIYIIPTVKRSAHGSIWTCNASNEFVSTQDEEPEPIRVDMSNNSTMMNWVLSDAEMEASKVNRSVLRREYWGQHFILKVHRVPQFRKEFNSNSVKVSKSNASIVIRCKIRSLEKPKITWLFQNVSRISASHRFRIDNTVDKNRTYHFLSKLTIISPEISDVGNYTCSLVNRAGSNSVNFTLTEDLIKRVVPARTTRLMSTSLAGSDTTTEKPVESILIQTAKFMSTSVVGSSPEILTTPNLGFETTTLTSAWVGGNSSEILTLPEVRLIVTTFTSTSVGKNSSEVLTLSEVTAHAITYPLTLTSSSAATKKSTDDSRFPWEAIVVGVISGLMVTLVVVCAFIYQSHKNNRMKKRVVSRRVIPTESYV